MVNKIKKILGIYIKFFIIITLDLSVVFMFTYLGFPNLVIGNERGIIYVFIVFYGIILSFSTFVVYTTIDKNNMLK